MTGPTLPVAPLPVAPLPVAPLPKLTLPVAGGPTAGSGDAAPPLPASPPTGQAAARPAAEAASLLRLCVPIVAGLSAYTLLGITDTIMISPLGTVPLAAASLTNAALIIAYSTLYGFVMPTGIEAARRHGEGNPVGVAMVLRAGLRLGGVAGVTGTALMALAWLLMPYLGQPPEVLEAARPYWFAMSIYLIPVALIMVVGQVLNAVDRAWTAAAFHFGAVILNVPLNYLLIWGAGTWPGLGLLGAGLASLAADVVALGAALVWLHRSGRLERGPPEPHLPRRLMVDGIPLSIGHLGEGAAFSVMGVLLGLFGAAALAANQIVNAVGAVLYMLPIGMATATSIRIGQAIGAGDSGRMRPILRTALTLVTSWMVLVTVALFMTGDDIAALLSDDARVVRIAAAMFVILALIQVADGIQSSSLGALRGAQDFRWPTAFTLICYWLFGLPMAAILGIALDLGPAGLWGGYGLGITLAAIVLPIRFWRLTRPQGRHRLKATASALDPAPSKRP